MQVMTLISDVKDALTVGRVFGEPIERDGATIIPVATIAGGGGGGSGSDAEQQEGQGGGFGLSAKPAGVYVIREGAVQWQPAVDVTRVVLAGVVLASIVALTTARVSSVRARAKR